jgi:hypothetical protein
MKNKGEILAALLKEFIDCHILLHNTRELPVVEKILTEGFIFENQLARSTDSINPDKPVETEYFLLQRKDYGPFTIVIAIPSTTYENYSCLSVLKDVCIEEVLTISQPRLGENDELIYTIPPEHILGYFNLITDNFYRNPGWDRMFSNDKASAKKTEP